MLTRGQAFSGGFSGRITQPGYTYTRAPDHSVKQVLFAGQEVTGPNLSIFNLYMFLIYGPSLFSRVIQLNEHNFILLPHASTDDGYINFFSSSLKVISDKLTPLSRHVFELLRHLNLAPQEDIHTFIVILVAYLQSCLDKEEKIYANAASYLESLTNKTLDALLILSTQVAREREIELVSAVITLQLKGTMLGEVMPQMKSAPISLRRRVCSSSRLVFLPFWVSEKQTFMYSITQVAEKKKIKELLDEDIVLCQNKAASESQLSDFSTSEGLVWIYKDPIGLITVHGRTKEKSFTKTTNASVRTGKEIKELLEFFNEAPARVIAGPLAILPVAAAPLSATKAIRVLED
jgi:hypothetical protein